MYKPELGPAGQDEGSEVTGNLVSRIFSGRDKNYVQRRAG